MHCLCSKPTLHNHTFMRTSCVLSRGFHLVQLDMAVEKIPKCVATEVQPTLTEVQSGLALHYGSCRNGLPSLNQNLGHLANHHFPRASPPSSCVTAGCCATQLQPQLLQDRHHCQRGWNQNTVSSTFPIAQGRLKP